MIEEAEVTICALKPELVPVLWPIIKPMVEMAIEHANGEIDLPSFLKQVENQEVLILMAYEGKRIVSCVSLEIRTFPTGKRVMNVMTAGGADMHLWFEAMLETINTLAAERSCDDIYVIGRKGWERMLRKKGYGIQHTVLSKKVEV